MADTLIVDIGGCIVRQFALAAARGRLVAVEVHRWHLGLGTRMEEKTKEVKSPLRLTLWLRRFCGSGSCSNFCHAEAWLLRADEISFNPVRKVYRSAKTSRPLLGICRVEFVLGMNLFLLRNCATPPRQSGLLRESSLNRHMLCGIYLAACCR
jgi:hypothetical protein